MTEPADWCSPIVVATKKGTDMCVDLSKLNKLVCREHYPSVTPEGAVADIQQSRAKHFTVFEGYHECPMDEESQMLTKFITPFGRFKYLRAPYGISSISEHYNRRMDEALNGIQGMQKIVDVVVFDQHNTWSTFVRSCVVKALSRNLNSVGHRPTLLASHLARKATTSVTTS